jgi:hypothetical protein
MRILVFRRLFIVLTGLAFLVGAAVQAMPPAEFMASACMGAAKTATGDCCANMAMKDHPAVADTTGSTIIRAAPPAASTADCNAGRSFAGSKGRRSLPEVTSFAKKMQLRSAPEASRRGTNVSAMSSSPDHMITLPFLAVLPADAWIKLARMPFDLGDHPARLRPASRLIGETCHGIGTRHWTGDQPGV